MAAVTNEIHARCPILDAMVLGFSVTVREKTQTNSLEQNMSCQIRKLYFSVV